MIRLWRNRRALSVALFGLTLCLCLGFSITHEPSVQIGVSTAAESGHSIETANWISGYIQQAHGISSIAHSSVPPHKNPYHGFTAINKSPIAFTSFYFLANPYFLHKIIVRLPHTDLIFPFHFFW